MKTLTDCFGRTVRLTDERLAHILEHPEMRGMESEIEAVLSKPKLVRTCRFGFRRTTVLQLLLRDNGWWQMAMRRG